MSLRFTVLASGSGGNASLVESDEFGLLIDAGLGPRELASRLSAVGRNWAAIHAVILTHTHTDHWKDRTLKHLAARHIRLFCYPGHEEILQTWSPAFPSLREAGLVQHYVPGQEISLASSLRCRAFPIPHDGGPTFAFRIEGAGDLFGPTTALGYAADLGCWDEEIVRCMCDVDLLAVEFNHDVSLERSSGRPAHLVARVLGDEGHLSNHQAAALLRAILDRSTPGRLRHLVQLHLSRDCNHPHLAQEAAQRILREVAPSVSVLTAAQDEPGTTVHLSDRVGRPSRPNGRGSTRRPRRTANGQPLLPGFLRESASENGARSDEPPG